MYRILLLSFGLVLIVPGHSICLKKCGRLMKENMSCCNDDIRLNFPPTDNLRECYDMEKKPSSCDVDICIAQKLGYASSDGTIDKKALLEMSEKLFENNPEIGDTFKEKCIDGDISEYGPADVCELTKKKLCFEIQVLKSCKEWKDDGDCKGTKDLAEECTKPFN